MKETSETITKTRGEEIQEKFCEIMKNYHAGNQKQAAEEACKLMENYVHSLIKGYRQRNDYEDIFQEGMLGIIENLGSYDPKKTKPTTFFENCIRHRVYCYTAENRGSTSYYESMRKKIAAQIKKFEEKGIPYTTQELAQICDLPIEAIKNTLTTAGAVTVEYIPTITEASMTEFKKSPEELTIEKEREEAFSKIIENACPKRDVQIFFAFHGINRPSMNFKEISEATGIASGEIRRIIQRTGRKLRGSLEMAQMASEYGRSERIRNMEEIHFIDDEEIDELIDEYSVI